MVCIRHHHTCVYRPAHTWESLFDDTDFVVIYLRSWNFYRRKQHRKILADKNVLSSTPVAAVFSTQRMYAFSCFISLFFLSLILTFFFSFSHPPTFSFSLILTKRTWAWMCEWEQEEVIGRVGLCSHGVHSNDFSFQILQSCVEAWKAISSYSEK